MARIFISPSKYVQGPGELARLGEYAKAYGTHALVVISEGGLRRSGDVITASLEAAGVALTYDNFNGECSQAEIDRLAGVFRASGADFVVGVGGGKIFDTAKAVAAAVDVPVVIVPTIAATDARAPRSPSSTPTTASSRSTSSSSRTPTSSSWTPT